MHKSFFKKRLPVLMLCLLYSILEALAICVIAANKDLTIIQRRHAVGINCALFLCWLLSLLAFINEDKEKRNGKV